MLFCDIVGFTPYSAARQPEEIVAALQQLFEAYEELAARYEMYKIKTIGDSFMSTAGLLVPVANPVLTAVRCGLEMVAGGQEPSRRLGRARGDPRGPGGGGRGRPQAVPLRPLGRHREHGRARGEPRLEGGRERQRRRLAAHPGRLPGRSLGLIPVKGKGEMEIFRVEALP